MTSKTDLTIQLFEKFGVPVFSALIAEKTPAPASPQQEAEKIAALLDLASQAGIGLATRAGIPSDSAQGDSARITLASLSTRFLSRLYSETGRMPTAADIERLNTIFESVLSFADAYAPAAQATGRLTALGPDIVFDETQIDALVLTALAPIIDAIAAFSFGRPEKILAQEIAGKLTATAASLTQKLSSRALSAPEAKLTELTLLRALCALFSACYHTETEKLLAMDETARAALAKDPDGTLSIAAVWSAFSLKVEMLEAVAEGIRAPAKAAPPSILSNALQTPETSVKPPEAAAPSPAPGPAEKPATPMGFFAKKKKDGDGT